MFKVMNVPVPLALTSGRSQNRLAAPPSVSTFPDTPNMPEYHTEIRSGKIRFPSNYFRISKLTNLDICYIL